MSLKFKEEHWRTQKGILMSDKMVGERKELTQQGEEVSLQKEGWHRQIIRAVY